MLKLMTFHLKNKDTCDVSIVHMIWPKGLRKKKQVVEAIEKMNVNKHVHFPVSSCGQCSGGEGLQRCHEVHSREQCHPTGEAQSHHSRDAQSAV